MPSKTEKRPPLPKGGGSPVRPSEEAMVRIGMMREISACFAVATRILLNIERDITGRKNPQSRRLTMLQQVHKGSLALADVLEEWQKEAAALPRLERDLGHLLDRMHNGPYDLQEVNVTVGGNAITVKMPVERLVEAKRAEISTVMDRLGNGCKAMDEACHRLMTFDPRPVETATDADRIVGFPRG